MLGDVPSMGVEEEVGGYVKQGQMRCGDAVN